MLGKQHYPQQCSPQTDKQQQETEIIYGEFDKVEAILDLSFHKYNKLAEKEAISLTHQHDDNDYYNDNPDDAVELIQTEICKYKEEDGRNKPPAKQQQMKQQNDNKENDENIHLTKQQAKQNNTNNKNEERDEEQNEERDEEQNDKQNEEQNDERNGKQNEEQNEERNEEQNEGQNKEQNEEQKFV